MRQSFSELLRDAEINRRLLGEALNVIEQKLESEDSSDVVIGGGSNLLSYPEYSDVDARQELPVGAGIQGHASARWWARNGSMEVTIRIGPENGVPELKDCSIVTASYRAGDDASGTLGIIGPTRMNYNRVISVMDFMGRALSEMLSDRTMKGRKS